jgi:hypothetical protein
MKKLLAIAFCVLSLGAQAHTKKSSNKLKKNTFTCIEIITVTGTVTYTCKATGITTTQNVSGTGQQPGLTCAAALTAATTEATTNYYKDYNAKLAALQKACVPN